MNTKQIILTGVVAALLAWSGVETYRYRVAKNQLAASLERQRTVETKLAHLKNLELAAKTSPVAKP